MLVNLNDIFTLKGHPDVYADMLSYPMPISYVLYGYKFMWAQFQAINE